MNAPVRHPSRARHRRSAAGAFAAVAVVAGAATAAAVAFRADEAASAPSPPPARLAAPAGIDPPAGADSPLAALPGAAAGHDPAAQQAGGDGRAAEQAPPVSEAEVLAPARASAPPPEPGVPVLVTEGRGWGHGRGMGQWGALGYATAWGSDHRAILDHFYGGTDAGWVDTAARDIRVRLQAADNRWFVATSETGDLVTNVTGGQRFRALLVIPQPDGGYALFAGDDCGGRNGWWFSGTSAWTVQLWIAGARADDEVRSSFVGICGREGVRYYRSWLEAIPTESGSRLVNHLPLELYLRGVVPREVPSWWGDRAEGRGMEALRAQAVAARSYAFTENRAPGGWNTCDTPVCQAYGGAALVGADGVAVRLEDRRADAAIRDTAGEVRVWPNGRVARTEYSASTGGHTSGGTFPAVADWGDPLPDNPNNRWNLTISAGPLERRFPDLGRIRAVEVTSRNGIGEWGGRVISVTVVGSAGSRTMDGESFGWYTGLGTDWFFVLLGQREP